MKKFLFVATCFLFFPFAVNAEEYPVYDYDYTENNVIANRLVNKFSDKIDEVINYYKLKGKKIYVEFTASPNSSSSDGYRIEVFDTYSDTLAFNRVGRQGYSSGSFLHVYAPSFRFYYCSNSSKCVTNTSDDIISSLDTSDPYPIDSNDFRIFDLARDVTEPELKNPTGYQYAYYTNFDLTLREPNEYFFDINIKSPLGEHSMLENPEYILLYTYKHPSIILPTVEFNINSASVDDESNKITSVFLDTTFSNVDTSKYYYKFSLNGGESFNEIKSDLFVNNTFPLKVSQNIDVMFQVISKEDSSLNATYTYTIDCIGKDSSSYSIDNDFTSSIFDLIDETLETDFVYYGNMTILQFLKNCISFTYKLYSNIISEKFPFISQFSSIINVFTENHSTDGILAKRYCYSPVYGEFKEEQYVNTGFSGDLYHCYDTDYGFHVDLSFIGLGEYKVVDISPLKPYLNMWLILVKIFVAYITIIKCIRIVQNVFRV